ATRIHKYLLIRIVIVFDLTIADGYFIGILVLKLLSRKILLGLFAQGLHRQVLFFQLARELLLCHCAILLLLINRGGNFIFARQKLFLFSTLEKHFALNQAIKYLQPCLG